MKNQTLIGNKFYLHTQLTTLGYDSLEKPSVLQAAVSAVFSAGVEAARSFGGIANVTPPSVQLISRQSEDTVVWFISFVVTLEGQRSNGEKVETKAVPGELQGIADVAAALGGSVNFSSQPPSFGSMLGGVDIGSRNHNWFGLFQGAKFQTADSRQVVDGTIASFGSNVSPRNLRLSNDEQHIWTNLFASAGRPASIQSTGSNATIIEASKSTPTRVIKATRIEESEQVHSNNHDRGRLPDITGL